MTALYLVDILSDILRFWMTKLWENSETNTRLTVIVIRNPGWFEYTLHLI